MTVSTLLPLKTGGGADRGGNKPVIVQGKFLLKGGSKSQTLTWLGGRSHRNPAWDRKEAIQKRVGIRSRRQGPLRGPVPAKEEVSFDWWQRACRVSFGGVKTGKPDKYATRHRRGVRLGIEPRLWKPSARKGAPGHPEEKKKGEEKGKTATLKYRTSTSPRKARVADHPAKTLRERTQRCRETPKKTGRGSTAARPW